jgi:hypothetical protein
MFGLGLPEIIVLVIIGILLFGFPAVALMLALALSRKSSAVSNAPSEIEKLRGEVERLREEIEELKRARTRTSTNVTAMPQ